MKKILKKGFTIVELVIVIAVIAILAAVLIPTFSGVIQKANLSNDVQICKNMNTQLATDFPTGISYPADITVTKESLVQYKKSFTPKTNGYHYYWQDEGRTVYLVNDANDNQFDIYFPQDEEKVVAKEKSFRLDSNYYTVSTDIDGITLDKKFLEEGSKNVEITLTATDVDMPKKVKIGNTEYTVTNNKITVASVTSNIVINEVAALAGNFLTFTATGTSSVTPRFKSGSNLQYRINEGDWTDRAINSTDAINLNDKDVLQLKGTNCINCTDNLNNYCSFLMTGSISASGSVTSLTDGLGINQNVILTDYCYAQMFSGCTSLTTAPSLPATSLAAYCYACMFDGCTQLTSAPDLPATTMTVKCYSRMFGGCIALTKAPELIATSLAESCYNAMFCNCTSLVAAPSLPATELAVKCYESMFEDCTSLTKAPKLPATTLVFGCYQRMFLLNNVGSLKISNKLPTGILGVNYGIIFEGIVQNVSSDTMSDMFNGVNTDSVLMKERNGPSWITYYDGGNYRPCILDGTQTYYWYIDN